MKPHVSIDDLVASDETQSPVLVLQRRLMNERGLSYVAASNLASKMLRDVRARGVEVRMTSGAEAVARFDKARAENAPKAAPKTPKTDAEMQSELIAELIAQLQTARSLDLVGAQRAASGIVESCKEGAKSNADVNSRIAEAIAALVVVKSTDVPVGERVAILMRATDCSYVVAINACTTRRAPKLRGEDGADRADEAYARALRGGDAA